MKIEREPLVTSTLEAFADKHGLVLVVTEHETKFNASFRRCEVAEGYTLAGVYGSGPTEESAIEDYRRQISGKRLVLNAYGADRKELKVPRLTSVWNKDSGV